MTSSPRFLGSPLSHAVLSDPDGTLHSLPDIALQRMAFRRANVVGSRNKSPFEAQHTAYLLAVYASQFRSLGPAQDSLPVGGLASTGQVSHLLGCS